MKEKLSLTTPRKRKYAPGVEASVPEFIIMGFRFHLEPDIDPSTGVLNGYKAEGCYIEVDIVGNGGVVETVRLEQDQSALDLVVALNTANLSTYSLRKHLINRVSQHQVQVGTDEQGEPVYEQPYAGDLVE